jgi:mRNA interferase RelE/StbE
MANYEVRFRRKVTKELRALPEQEQIRILKKVRRLAVDPRPPGAIKLSGQERYRIRQGDYQIIYEIFDDKVIVVIVRVRHRREAY